MEYRVEAPPQETRTGIKNRRSLDIGVLQQSYRTRERSLGTRSKHTQSLNSSNSFDEASRKIIEKAFDELSLSLIRDTGVSSGDFFGKVIELRLNAKLNDIYTYNIIVYNENYKRLPSKNVYWPENEGKFVNERIAISFYK